MNWATNASSKNKQKILCTLILHCITISMICSLMDKDLSLSNTIMVSLLLFIAGRFKPIAAIRQ